MVEHVAGDILFDLIGFSEHGPSQPEKLLLRLARSGWSSCCLSAFIAFWNPLTDRDLEDIGRDYSGVPHIDYCEHWPIRGARIQSIICARAAGQTSVTIETDAGVLVLREVDGSDPHSDSELLWRPAPSR